MGWELGGSTHELLVVHGLDRGVGLGLLREGNESETARAAGSGLSHDDAVDDLSEPREKGEARSVAERRAVEEAVASWLQAYWEKASRSESLLVPLNNTNQSRISIEVRTCFLTTARAVLSSKVRNRGGAKWA